MTLEELDALPSPDYLIEGVLAEATLGIVYGLPKCGKTFLVLDWALSIASGRDWCGRRVKQSVVVYVAGEGVKSLKLRIRAWCIENGVGASELKSRFFVVDSAVQLVDPSAVEQLLGLLKDKEPDLIILDTLARCAVGVEENSAQEVGELVAACDRLVAEMKATVLLVHHSTKADDSIRGSSAIHGAVDTAVHVGRTGRVVTVVCSDQKDGDPFEPARFDLETVDLPVEGGEPERSCVLVASDPATGDSATLDDKASAVLVALCDDAATAGLAVTDLAASFDVSRSSLHRVVERLETRGYVRVEKRKRQNSATATDLGRAFVAKLVATRRNLLAATPPSPRRTSHGPGSLKGPGTATAGTDETGERADADSGDAEVDHA